MESEVAWVRLTALADRDAFERLYRTYQAPLFRYFVRMTGDAEAAGELVNDVMLAVWKGAGTYRGASKPSTWIFGIAHHKALNAQVRRPPPTLPVEDALRVTSAEEAPDERMDRARLPEDMRGALAGLPAEQREVVQLTFFHGLSYAEIAAAVGCPVNTVKTRMFHARRKLQEMLGGGRRTAEAS